MRCSSAESWREPNPLKGLSADVNAWKFPTVASALAFRTFFNTTTTSHVVCRCRRVHPLTSELQDSRGAMGTPALRLRSSFAGIIKLMLVLAVLLFAGVLALGAYLYVSSRQLITLPAPTGPYAVGRTSFDWIDDSRFDPLAPHPGPKT